MASNIANFFRGKNALITGSTQGIGLEIARTLAAAGCNVTLHGLAPEATTRRLKEEISAEHGVQVNVSNASLLDPKQIREMVKDTQDKFGGLDILVNNAGIQFVSSVQEFPEQKWNDVVDVCMNAPFHATKAALPSMVSKGWGRIVNTGSMHALVASPYKSAYNAAKHGVAGFTKTVALEVATTGVTVNAICPGYVLTDLVKNQIEDTARVRNMPREDVISKVLLADQPTKRFVEPREVANLVLHLCGPHSGSITGACLSIDGGWTAR